jgi:hypothetical protein
MNIRNQIQKVAFGNISGLEEKYKFHFDTILDLWFKIDIQEAFMPDVAFIFSIDVTNQKNVNKKVETQSETRNTLKVPNEDPP